MGQLGETDVIRASSVVLMPRPHDWPPKIQQLEYPEDWRLSVLTKWSDAWDGYFLQLQDAPPRPVTCCGRIVAFAGRNAMGRAFAAANQWTTGWARRRRLLELWGMEDLP